METDDIHNILLALNDVVWLAQNLRPFFSQSSRVPGDSLDEVYSAWLEVPCHWT